MMGNLSFAQVKQGGTAVPGQDNRFFEHITCHGCQERGHYRNQCPTQKNVTLTQFVLNQQQLATINPNWILLDTCSTVSVFCNRKLIHDIQPCEPNQELHIITNGGSETFPYTATSNLLPIPVHFNPHSLANILSLSSVANIPGARITMDTHVEKAILLHVNGQTYKFLECQDGLYFYDTKHLPNHSNTMLSNYSAPSSYHFLQRVDDNKAFYTRRQIEGADTARRIQASIGFPSTPVFKQIIQNNLIRNCGITVEIPPQKVSNNINFPLQVSTHKIIDENVSTMHSTYMKCPLQRDKVRTHVTWADKVKTPKQTKVTSLQ